MTEIVLFDRKGTFLPLADDVLATLMPQRQELYADVAEAAANMVEADAELVAATDAVKACADAVRDAEKQMPKPMTQTQLAKQHIASERARRVNRQ